MRMYFGKTRIRRIFHEFPEVIGASPVARTAR